jgi:hypothetical protein
MAGTYRHFIRHLVSSRKSLKYSFISLITQRYQLFGHEIVGVLCGVVWGLGIGFAIVAAGTFLGEVGNF